MMATTMQAAVCLGYGGPDRIAIETRPVPRPARDEMLVAVAVAAVNSADVRVRTLNVPRGLGLVARLMFGFSRPRQPILGVEYAGIVVAVGEGTSRFAVGDPVIVSSDAMGGHAQYAIVGPKAAVAAKPPELTFEQAAAIAFGGTTALDFLRRAGLRADDKLLVVGASGSVGLAMVQLGRYMGAHVVGATSAGNRALVESVGAHETLDYKMTDYTAVPEAYDVIADTVGASSFARCFEALRPGGRYLAVAGGLGDMLARSRGGKESVSGMVTAQGEDIRHLADLAASGAFVPVIDRRYPLAEAAAAHAYVETGRKRGSVLLTMPDAS